MGHDAQPTEEQQMVGIMVAKHLANTEQLLEMTIMLGIKDPATKKTCMSNTPKGIAMNDGRVTPPPLVATPQLKR